MFIATIKRELLLNFRQPAEMLNPLVFFVLVVSLFPLGISPSADVLQMIAPGVIWVAALLATLLSMESMFRSDYEDGSLEQIAVSPQPLDYQRPTFGHFKSRVGHYAGAGRRGAQGCVDFTDARYTYHEFIGCYRRRFDRRLA